MRTLSIDIGASSGRIYVTDFDGNSFFSVETYRFQNEMVNHEGHLCWDFESMMSNILQGLSVSFSKYKEIRTIGIDSFAVDYGLLDKRDNLISWPLGYRDYRNQDSMAKVLSKVDYRDIYQESGIQKLDFNTIFQLADDISKKKYFSSFLLIPDLIAFYLTGIKKMELTNLSTTALYNPLTRSLSHKNMNLIGLKEENFSPIIYPSSLIGHLKQSLLDQYHLYDCEVVAVGSHDTASAVASAPIDSKTAFLASGTWSLLGIELDSPLINDETYSNNFTNEIGLDHSIRFLKNIMGLFILQEIRHDYVRKEKEISFQEIAQMAQGVTDNSIYIDIEDECFKKPGNMIEKYYSYLKKTNQYQGEMELKHIARSIYESMAFKYVREFHTLKRITGKEIQRLCVIGGGAYAKLLNQLIADSLNIEVITGEGEATVYGNTLAQLIYLGLFKDHIEARKVLSKSTIRESYLPKDTERTAEKYKDYLNTISIGGK